MQKLINDIISIDQQLSNDFDQYIGQLLFDGIAQLKSLVARMESPVAWVVVAGSFNSGKSAFINSLLGDDICPVRGNPTTSAVTTIKHGKLAIYEILEDEKKRIISKEQYSEMVTHKSGEADKTASGRHEFEVNHPAEILKHVILVDTPGFHSKKDNPYDDEITKSCVKRADVIIWLTDINTQVKSTEFKILQSEEFVNPHGGKYLILTKADSKKDPHAREKIHLAAKNDPYIGELFQDVLIYSSDDVKNGKRAFAEEHRQLCEVLIQSGKLATNYVNKGVYANLESYLVKSGLILDRVCDQIPPGKSVRPYVKERTDKILSMIEKEKEKIKSDALEKFKLCWHPVEVSSDEKSYITAPYAKIIVDTDAKELIKYVRNKLFLHYEDKLRKIIDVIEKQGIVLDSDNIIKIFSPNAFSEEIEKIANNIKTTLVNNINNLFHTGKTKKDYYYDINDAVEHCKAVNNIYSYDVNIIYSSIGYNIYNALSEFVESEIQSLISVVAVLECKRITDHPQKRFKDAMTQRNKIINCLKNILGMNVDDAKDADRYGEEAEHGDAEAQYKLDKCDDLGKGVSKDFTEAETWHRKAAEQGNADAQNYLGSCYYHGTGLNQDYAEAFKWFWKAAEQGNADAQNYLGSCYYHGTGIYHDYAEAVKWFLKAAEQGHVDAQNNLGNCYFHGTGLKQDYADAVIWFWKAAEQGDAEAQYKLGDCYYHGTGLYQDRAEAVKWYRKAAEQGYKDAQLELDKIKF